MARLPRFFADGEALHVIQRGNNRDPVFGAEPDYLFYLDCLERAASEYALAIHAYVLMTNHVHLLATPSREASLVNNNGVGPRRHFDPVTLDRKIGSFQALSEAILNRECTLY